MEVSISLHKAVTARLKRIRLGRHKFAPKFCLNCMAGGGVKSCWPAGQPSLAEEVGRFLRIATRRGFGVFGRIQISWLNVSG
jgi:hypothetical protein